MKLLIFILGISLIAIQVHCLPEWIKHAEKCKEELGLPKEQSGPPDLNDPNMKCFITCMGQKMDMIKEDESIDEEAVVKKLKKMIPNASADEKYEEKMRACVVKGNAASGHCEKGLVLYRCIEKAFKKD